MVKSIDVQPLSPPPPPPPPPRDTAISCMDSLNYLLLFILFHHSQHLILLMFNVSIAWIDIEKVIFVTYMYILQIWL